MNNKATAPIDTLLQQISVHIEAKMKQAGLKKKALAKLADVNQNTITAITSGGDMKLSTLIRVTRVVGDTEWLLSLLEQPQKSPLERLNKANISAQVHLDKPAARMMGRRKTES
jgi:predicted transcriptional regulator